MGADSYIRRQGTPHLEVHYPQEARWREIKPRPAPATGLRVLGPFTANFPATRGNSNGQTVWYTSELEEDIPLPPVITPPPSLGAIYVHRNRVSGDVLVWCFDQSNSWTVIPSNARRYAHPNPDNSDRFFRLTKEGRPSWVVSATLQKYESEADRRKAAVTTTRTGSDASN